MSGRHRGFRGVAQPFEGAFQTTRRGLLVGGSSVLASTGLAHASHQEVSYWFEYDTDAKRELVRLVELRRIWEPPCEPEKAQNNPAVPPKDGDSDKSKDEADRPLTVSGARVVFAWRRDQFGDKASFLIERRPEYDPVSGKEQIVRLTVRDAQFPGGAPFTFDLKLARKNVAAVWRMSATIGAWWTKNTSLDSEGPGLRVEDFLGNDENRRLSFHVPAPQASALAKSLFGDRLQIGVAAGRQAAVLSVDRTLTWRIKAPPRGHLFILHTALAFTTLSFRRMRLSSADGITFLPGGAEAIPSADARREGQGTIGGDGLPGQSLPDGDTALNLIERFAASDGDTKQAASNHALVGTVEGVEDFGDDVLEAASGSSRKPDRRVGLLVGSVENDNQRSAVRIVFGAAEKEIAKTFDATLAHFGDPRLTIAACRTKVVPPPSSPGRTRVENRRTIGRLFVVSTENGKSVEEGPFDFADFQVTRQARKDGQVVTLFRLSSSEKEYRARTEIGDMDLGGLPPVQARPGDVARAPGFEIWTTDREDRRVLTSFEGRLALWNLAISLPERFDEGGVPSAADIAPSVDHSASIDRSLSTKSKHPAPAKRPASPAALAPAPAGPPPTPPASASPAPASPGHIARLDFTGADVLVYLPLLGPAPQRAVDAKIPLGALPKALAETLFAQFSLARACLRVIRPADLLSLKYRFSGLALNLPVRASSRLRPFVAPFGGMSNARAEPAALGRARQAIDQRPIMVVEFPPQHVAEQAFFRRVEELPDLPAFKPQVGKEKEFGENLKGLRRPKQWRKRGFDSDNDNEKPTTSAERVDFRKALLAATEKGDKSTDLVFQDPSDPDGSVRVPLQKFLDKFAEAAGNARLPQEQKFYCGPEFLDPDARRIARQALIVLRPTAPTPRDVDVARNAPDVRLDPSVVLAILRRSGITDLGGVDDGKKQPAFPRDPVAEFALTVPGKPEFEAERQKNLANYRAAIEEVEREKERRDADYAEFRRRFAKAAESMDGAKVAVLDPAQYRGREWFKSLVNPAAPILRPDNAQNVLDAVRATVLGDDGQDAFTPRAEARLAGPSRIAFRVNSDDFETARIGGRIPFSLEGMTNWGSMDMAVARRAERLVQARGTGPLPPRWQRVASTDASDILRFQRISSDGEIAGKPSAPTFRRKRRALERLGEVYASAKDAPDTFETALELPFRLFLSPAQDATWKTPSDGVARHAFADPPNAGGSAKTPHDLSLFREVWTARLSGTDEIAGVRAVWSPDFRPEALLSTAAPGAPLRGSFAPWSIPRDLGIRKGPETHLARLRLPMDAYDRHELVVLSSVHGLPVLGRRQESGALFDLRESSQFEPPPGYRLNDVELEEDVDRTSIYAPRALSVSELSLSALGGSINLDTHFVPPAPARLRARKNGEPGTNLFDAFSIERWRQRSVMGRDISVEVVYKGFLFPLGHRASLVKLTERRFESRGPEAPPVAYLVQRMFLRVGDPIKTFPAYDHPNRARRFPADKITVLTRRTPDIVDPTIGEKVSGVWSVANSGKIGLLKTEDSSTGLVFWPRTAPRDGGEVWFEMQVGAESVPVRMPLIFVDFVAANDPPTIRSLVAYYNGLKAKDSPGRRLARFGQPVKMAPETKAGDTTFETAWWDLKAEGRASAAVDLATNLVDNHDFTRNSFMEGLDQAPFYPLIDAARIRLTQMERFTGSGPVWAIVAYSARYVRNGFGDEPDVIAPVDSSNADELYLLVLPKYDDEDQSPIQQRMGDRGDLSGGIAHPDLDVIGLSRRYGPYGRNDVRPFGGPASSAGTKPESTDSNSPPTPVPSVETNDTSFKATSLFPDNARILGLVKLSDILVFAEGLLAKEAPRLLETLEYGAATAAGGAGNVRTLLLDNVIRPALEIVERVGRQWEAVARREAQVASKRLSLGEAYPDIGRDLNALEGALRDAQSTDRSDADFFAQLPKIHEVGRQLIRTIERIGRDPFAAVSEKQLGGIRALKNKFDAFANAVETSVKSNVPREILDGVGSYLTSERAVRQLVIRIPITASELVIPGSVSLSTQQISTALGEVENALDDCTQSALISGISAVRADLPDDALSAFQNAVVDTFRDRLTNKIDNASGVVGNTLRAVRNNYFGSAAIKANAALILNAIKTPFFDKASKAIVAIAVVQARVESDKNKLALSIVGTAFEVLPQLLPLLEVLGLSEAVSGLTQSCADARTALKDLLDKIVPNESSLRALAACTGVLFDSNGMETGVCSTAGAATSFSKRAIDALKAFSVFLADISDPKSKDDLTAARRQLGLAANVVAVALLRFEETFATFKDSLAGSACFDLPDVRSLRTLKETQAAVLKAAASLQPAISAASSAVHTALPSTSDRGATNALESIRQLVELTKIGRGIISAASVFAYETQAKANEILAPVATAIDALAVKLDPPAPAPPIAKNIADVLRAVASDVRAIPTKAFLSVTDAQALTTKLKDVVDSLPDAASADIRSSLQVAAGKLKEAADLAQKQFDAVARTIVDEIETKLFDVLRQLLFAAVSPVNDITETVVSDLAKVSTIAVELYKALSDARNEAESLVKANKIAEQYAHGLEKALGVSELFRVMKQGVSEEQLDAELKLVRAIDSALKQPATSSFAALQNAYSPSKELAKLLVNPAILELARRFARLDAATLKLAVIEAIDLRQIREDLERLLSNLIPTRITLSYDLDCAVQPALGGIFLPAKNTRLTLMMRATTDLRASDLTPQVTIGAAMGPFDVSLLGQIFEAVVLQFRGLSFSGGSHRDNAFKVDFAQVKVGRDAEFLKQLQAYLSPSGDGPFVRAIAEFPGIEAGYGLNLGTFGVGTLSFSNVTLNASARLPFSNSTAQFVVSIGRPDAPFLISSTIFGGGGYLALIASAQGFIGLEASFDFGGVFAFGFGPLVGAGQITFGVYFRAVQGEPPTLGTNFMVRGAATICGFGIAASLLVRLTMQGGQMQGMAEFTFTFSFYVGDISFTVKVQKNAGSRMGGEQQSADYNAVGTLPQYASFLDPDAPAPNAWMVSSEGRAVDARVIARIEVETVARSKDWRGHQAYYNSALLSPQLFN